MIGFPRIFQKFEISGLDTIHIRQNGFECATSFVGNGMLFVSDPSHEVIHADVVRVLDDVMHDTLVGVSFGIEEDGTRLLGKSLEHETMSLTVVEMAHYGVYKPSFAVVGSRTFFAHSGTMPQSLFNSVGAHEIALIGVSP